MRKIDAFILVGGKSSRMGRDKSSVQIDGISMADRSIQTVKCALPDSRITLVGGANAELADNHLDRGAWSGFEAALSYSQAEWAFVMACDYPLMSPGVIKLIVSKASDRFDAIVPTQADGKLQPLCALYRTGTCLTVATRILPGNETPPLRVMFENVRTSALPFAEFEQIADVEHAFLNVNTETDLEKATSLLEARRLSVAK